MSESDTISIEELNKEEAKKHVGGAIFVGILMVIGFIGNLHVLYIYTFKMITSNHRVFILCLAVFDTVTCVIGMPFVLVDLTRPLTFTMVGVCKVLRFNNYFMCCGSALVLVAIAVERYKKICVPHGRQMTLQWAKISVGIALGIALAVSWPAFVLYGHNTVETRVANITGVRCFTDDKFRNTKYQAYFNIVLIIIAFGVFLTLVVLYGLIGNVILKHGSFRPRSSLKKGHSSPSDEEDRSSKYLSTTGIETLQTDTASPGNRDSAISVEETASSSNDGDRKDDTTTPKKKNPKTKRQASMKGNSTGRMTLILFLITAVFFMSFIPHLVLKIITFLNTDFIPGLSESSLLLYNTFIWCFFINNMANPIIYGFCDLRFRQYMKNIYSNIGARIRKR